MKRSIAMKMVALAALALAGVGAVKTANAGTDVYFSLGVPASVYARPPVVYTAPPLAYAPPPVVYEQSQPVYVTPAYGYDYSWQQRRAWREAQWRRHREWEARREWREHHHRWRDDD